MEIAKLADLLRETAEHHDHFEKIAPPHDWWDWYAPSIHDLRVPCDAIRPIEPEHTRPPRPRRQAAVDRKVAHIAGGQPGRPRDRVRCGHFSLSRPCRRVWCSRMVVI